ncbi:MAG: hypothetical protein IT373_22685 [Polyangiaceae bacterium]|nr:hypothetical protein [Polyangiaceae bacterium]
MKTPKVRHPPAHAQGRPDSGRAFLPDMDEAPVRTRVDLAEELAEEFVRSAVSGEESLPDLLEEEQTEELGGPFVTTSATREFALGADDSNPAGALREAFPRANAGPQRR